MSDVATVLPGKTSYYMPAVRQNGEGADYYALVVRVDKDGSLHVIHGYKGRTFTTEDKAIRSCEKYITSRGLNAR